MRFRNHISVIFENSIKTIGTVFFVFILNFLSDAGETGISTTDLLFLAGVLVVVLVIVLGWQAILWSRTYISIEDSILIVERNTLNKKRNTIGLKNISNVNLEQNLLEMILGTCKVKLDTNSLSTADQTDVNIVLKKADAENFRQIILTKAEGKDVLPAEDGGAVGEQVATEAQIRAETQRPVEGQNNSYIGDIGDIILHGLFSIRLISVIMFVGIIVIQTAMIWDLDMSLGESIAEMAVSLFTAYWLAAVALWSILKEFIKYINFRIERKKDKVLLSYGLFKKIAYSVPVDKINGIRLSQTPIARMGKHYMVEIINVGMDDDETEANTFFLPYAKKEKIAEQLHMLLPEFDGCMDIQEEKQAKCIWILWIPWILLFLSLVGIGYMAMAEFEPDLKEAVLFAAGVIALWRLVVKAAGFLTKGVAVHDQFLKIVDGAFGRRTLFVKYPKIQYVTGKQNVIAKHFKIQKATISLLASMKNRIHELPYFKENDMEVLKKHLIQ